MDRNIHITVFDADGCRRSLRGNVDRNFDHAHLQRFGVGRSLRGNVDRNRLFQRFVAQLDHVVPYVGTWIEISPAITPS